MAWHSGLAWAYGSALPSASLTDIAENLDYLYRLPACRVYCPTTFTPSPDGSSHLLTGWVEEHDSFAMFNASTDASKLVIPAGLPSAWYRVSVTLSWAANATGYRRAEIMVNGVSRAYSSVPAVSTAGQLTTQRASEDLVLSAGDYVQVYAGHGAGVSLNITGPAAKTSLSVIYQSAA